MRAHGPRRVGSQVMHNVRQKTLVRRKTLSIWIIILILASSTSCTVRRLAHPTQSAAGIDLRDEPLDVSAAVAPEDTWRQFRAFLDAVARGATCDSWQLQRSVAFFEIVTGMESGLDGTALGLVLDRRQLAEDLESWDAWHSANSADFDVHDVAAQLSRISR